MVCLNPLKMVKNKITNKHYNEWEHSEIIDIFDKLFSMGQSFRDIDYVHLKCGSCKVCRFKKIQEWKLRLMKEGEKSEGDNYFITFTYNEDKVTYIEETDKWGKVIRKTTQLNYRDFQLFLKRLRQQTKSKFKYFVVSEYGKKHGRIHFHAFFMNLKVSDIKEAKGFAKKTFKSEKILKAWGNGHIDIKEFNVKTTFYALKYFVKPQLTQEELRHNNLRWKEIKELKKLINIHKKKYKITAKKKLLPGKKYAYEYIKTKEKITQLDPQDIRHNLSELEDRLKLLVGKTRLKNMFQCSSGIGLDYFLKNKDSILKQRHMSISNDKGKKIVMPIPRYFLEKINELFPEEYEQLMIRMYDDIIIHSTEIKQQMKQKGLTS